MPQDMEEPIFRSELISPMPFPLLAPNEPRTPITILSPAQRTALIACLADGTLSKRCGVWTSQSAHACGRRIEGVTVADLIREGMLTVSVLGRSAEAPRRG
jgi:hypothetical protein